jgi:hypothetical protein
MTTTTIDILQTELNQQIYNDLRYYLESAGQIVDREQAFHLLVNAVSTNLGAILAQVPDAYRNEFIKISNDIITVSLTETLKSVTYAQWGQIGHA